MSAPVRKKSAGLPGAMLLFALILFSPTTASPAARSYRIIENGASSYAIVLAGDASPSEKHAAAELRKFLELATGANLPVVEETDPRAGRSPRFFIGPGKLARETSGISEPDWKPLGDEGFMIRILNPREKAPDVLIAGGRLRGTMYGVYTFLDHIGFRWYTNRVTVFPKGPNLDIPFLNEKTVPDFMYREPSIKEAFDADWAARNRVNSHFSQLDETRGGTVGVLGVHTFDYLIPTTLFKAHPEFFPLIGGKRVTGYVQRCLSAPGLAEATAANLNKWMDENPTVKIFCLSQSDTESQCECPECTEFVRREGSPSGLYLDFVNKVAEIVEKTHPDRFVCTLAYMFTEPPPRTIRPRDNVIIYLCPISLCTAHPFTKCTEQAAMDFRANLEGWSKLTNRIFVWHYATDFANYLMPFPDFREFAADIRNYRNRGVSGLFLESSEATDGAADSELRAWVMARLLWNPDLDPDALVNEWMRVVYGKAFPPMRAYFNLIHTRVSPPESHLHIFEAPGRDRWPDRVVASMDSLFRESLRLTEGDSVATWYVRKNHLAVEFLRTWLGSGQLVLENGVYRPSGNTVSLEDCDRFIRNARSFGVSTLGAGWSDSDNFTLLRQRFESHPTVSIENADLKLTAVPDLGGRIISILNKRTGKNILSLSGPANNSYPCSGGYEEMTAQTWGCTGFADTCRAEVEGRTLTLSSLSANGLEFRRVISLGENGLMIQFDSSITNRARENRICQLVCRPEFEAGHGKSKVLALDSTGNYRVPTPTEIKDNQWPFLQKNARFDGPNKPAGGWRLEHPSGWTVETRFNPEDVASFNVILPTGEGSGEIYEIHTPEKELAPDERITLQHTMEITGR